MQGRLWQGRRRTTTRTTRGQGWKWGRIETTTIPHNILPPLLYLVYGTVSSVFTTTSLPENI